MRNRILCFVIISAFVSTGFSQVAVPPAGGEAKPVTIQVTAPPMPAANLEELDKILVVPDGKTASELFEYINESRTRAIKTVLSPQSTDEEFDIFQKKYFQFVIKVTDKIIALQPTDEHLEQAYGIKMIVTSILWEDDPSYEKPFNELFDTIKKQNKFPTLIAQGYVNLLMYKVLTLYKQGAENIKPEDVIAIKDEVKVLLAKKVEQVYGGLVAEVCALASEVGLAKNDKEFAAKIEDELFKYFKDSTDEQLKEIGEVLPSIVRTNIGKETTLEGLKLDGTKFDWNTYRGKVVLLEFWAIESPEFADEYQKRVALYSKYKAKGFDIVFVELDRDAAATAKFFKDNKTEWAVLSDSQTVKSKLPSLFDSYNVDQIPKTYVIDKEGRIAAVSHTDAELTEKLEKLLAK
jgi:peroxiredoxin